MVKKINNLLNNISRQKMVIMPPVVALRSVTSRSGAGVYASSDTLYKGAVFGRDSLEVAEDIMHIKPKLVRNILVTLASLQGSKLNKISEEEPGKIVHEYRNVIVDGKPINDMSKKIFEELASKWGGNDQEMSYYGSVDSTPQFLRTLGQYRNIYGDSILNTKVAHKDGGTISMRQVAENATDWVLKKVSASESGLLEFKKMNVHGISNQVWKDSEEFYVHENGEQVNHNAPIASIEVQGLVYDGLIAASAMFPEKSAKLIYAADTLRDTTLDMLWLPNKGYFALGLCYDPKGNIQIIKTLSANQAALLDTGFFDNLPSDKREKFNSGIVRTMLGHEFLTDAGIRSRALSGGHLVDHWDYHGSFVSWPKETYDIAKGLRRQGFPKLARQLENRIINVCLSYKAYPEFVYVDEKGRVLAGPPSSSSHSEFVFIEGTNQPEHIQAWTVSAATAIVSGRVKNKLKPFKSIKPASGQSKLENELMAAIPYVNRHLNPFSLNARYPSYKYKIKSKSE